jgi:hypothetical protein
VDGAAVRKSGGAQAGSFFGSAANRLDSVPAKARLLVVSGRAPDFPNLPDFRELEIVVVYDRVTEREIRVLAQLRSVRMLSLYNLQATNADPLAALRGLEHLHLNTAPKLTRLQFLKELPALRTLWLEHLRGLHELSHVGALTQLRGLDLAGSMWTAMRLRNLEPLSALIHLQQLRLVNVRVADGSLLPLRGLARLRRLWVPNWFAVAEFAALAASLPTTEGDFHSPWFYEPKPVETPSYDTCKRCGRYSLGMTLGKPAKQLCPHCDAIKVAKVVMKWGTLVAQAKTNLG